MSRKAEAQGQRAEFTLVSFALKEEAAPFRKRLTGSEGAAIRITGIGRKQSEAAFAEFLQRRTPQIVFTCGFAGGLNPALNLGDVVYSTPDQNLASRLTQAGAKPANFHCADRVASTAAEKAALRQATGADAVEMESAVIHAICQQRGIPCATVRVISDAATDDLPLDFNQLAKPDQNLHYGKLALAIAKSPGKIPALLQLQRRTRRAAEALARVLIQVV